MKYPTCRLSNIVNPAVYCVVSTDSEHVSEVLQLERSMKQQMLNQTDSEFEFCDQMCVGVMDSKRSFKRGVIQKKIEEDLYQVLLIDYGYIVYVGKSKLRVITNKNFMKVEPLAFVVKLYGMVPTKFTFVGDTKKYRASAEWIAESKTFVENLFKDDPRIVVQNILIQQRTVYGDLFLQLKPDTKFVSLRKLLSKHDFCVYSENHFLRKEGLESSSDSVEFETKMERVEKWRRENFNLESPAPSSKGSSGEKTPLENRHLVSRSACEVPEQTAPDKQRKSETTSEAARGLGIGRGKIKMLIAEMKKREGMLHSGLDSPKQHESTSPREKKAMGRGHFLKKYLESKSPKSSERVSGSDVAGASSWESAGDLIKSDSDAVKSSSQDTKEGVQATARMKKATVRGSDFSEISSSMVGVSLSTGDEIPPLVRNVSVGKKVTRTIVPGGRRSELNKSDSDLKTNATEYQCVLSKKEKKRKENERENWNAADFREECFNQVVVKSCWTPYVRFDDSVVEPVRTFQELPIQPSIIRNLKKGGPFNCLSQVQSWAIPAIRKLLNAVIIGGSKTGKTLSYVVHLMDYLQDESYFEELPPGNGPSVVIVASSSRVCESIYYLCYSLLGCYSKRDTLMKKIKIVLAHGGCEKDVWVSLTNGCDVIISTPHCLARLLEMPVVTNLERLTCLVLDEIDVISENPFRKSVRIILERAQFNTKSRYCQKVLCGEKWTASVANLVKSYVESYALIIGSYSEAVVYGGIKPSIYLVEQSKKKEALLDKLKELTGERNTIVFCERVSEAITLNEFLKGKGISTLLAHDRILADKLKDTRTAWKSSDMALIATDGVLNELNIREARALIHYGLPSISKTNFYLRYFTLENFLCDRRKFAKSENKTPVSKLQGIILIDEENQHQLPHIVEFVARLGGKVSTEILQKCQEIRRQVEVEKFKSPICENLLALGRCHNLSSCPRRHALVQTRDASVGLPPCGWVNFFVLRTHDASCFSVRLVEHTDLAGKTSKLEDSREELSQKISEFFILEDNRRPHGMPKIGDCCAVQNVTQDGKIFHRAKIIEYLKVDRHGKPLEVSVKLIDQGDVWTRKSLELYELPEELSKYPPVAVDVRLVGVQPLDFDVSWSHIANDFARDLMTQELSEDQFWSGKIVLALNGTLFLDPVKRKQLLPQLNTYVFDLLVREEFLNNGIAVANDQHLPSLLRLCSEGGIDIPETEEIKGANPAVIQPQWAFLYMTDDFVPVRFLAAENTSTVFLQNQEFEKLLMELEEDCQREGEKTRNEIKSDSLRVGMYCLALFEDGKWNRGRIESEKEEKFYVYFVDHGDFLFISKTDVVPISESLLLRLPCQAIECSLIGVEEMEECPLEVLERIYAFSDDGKKDLYAFVVSKDLKASVTGGRKYSLNLVDGTGVSINKMLVDEGLVRPKETEREHLRHVEMKLCDDEGDEEEKEEEEEADVDEDNQAGGDLCPTEEEATPEVAENYVTKLTDDMFEDEGAQQFLKEFAAKVFKIPITPAGNSKTKEKVEGSASEFTKVGKAEKEGSCRKLQGEPLKDRDGGFIQKIKELHKKRLRKTKKKPELKGRDQVCTPQVLWCQNQLEVQLKILLGNVKDYSFECTVSNISFRCYSGEKFYSVDLRLFGAVNPQMTKLTLKAFHVGVVLTKLAFPLWPRLHADEGKLRWINLDVESLTEKEGFFTDKIKTAKLEIESGALKKGVRNERVAPCSDSEESNADVPNSDSDSDDPY